VTGLPVQRDDGVEVDAEKASVSIKKEAFCSSAIDPNSTSEQRQAWLAKPLFAGLTNPCDTGDHLVFRYTVTNTGKVVIDNPTVVDQAWQLVDGFEQVVAGFPLTACLSNADHTVSCEPNLSTQLKPNQPQFYWSE